MRRCDGTLSRHRHRGRLRQHDLREPVARQAETRLVVVMRRVLVAGAAKIHHDDAVGGADLDVEGLVLRRAGHPQAMRCGEAALQAEHQGKQQTKKAQAAQHAAGL
jgi:hypothetical protein